MGQSLFVANITKQHHTFTYRAPESSAIRQHNIPPGTQVRIEAREMEAPEIDFILKQYAIYGIVAEKDIPRRKGFIGQCYSIGKPVNIDSFLATYEHNDEVLQKENDTRMEQSAIAISDRLGKVSEATPLTQTAIENVEEGDTPTIAKGVRVTPDESSRPRAQRRNGRR